MKKAELQLITEIRKQFSVSINEAIEDLAFVIIEPRAPEDASMGEYESYINVHGTFESGSKGWAGTQKKWVGGERVECEMCGGAKRVKLSKAIGGRVDYLADRIEFMVGEMAKGKMSKNAIRDRESRIKAYEKDIKFFKDMAVNVKDADNEILCPVCNGMEWLDVEDYKDPRAKKKAKTPWKKVMAWLWDTLEAANLSPIQGATDPAEAGFAGPDDKYGLEISNKNKPENEKSDIKRSIKIATKSLGVSNRRVFENLAKILKQASSGLEPFKLERWPAKGMEDKAQEEQGDRKAFAKWVDQNRTFYITGRAETQGLEDIGLEPFDILPPHNFLCKKCGAAFMLSPSYAGRIIECPACGNANKVMEEPERSGTVDIEQLRKVIRGEIEPGEEEEEEEEDREKKFPIPPSTAQRGEEWQDIIRHIKGYSAQRRTERSEKGNVTYKKTPEYHEKFTKPKEEKAERERARREWSGPKYEYWDKFVEELAEEASIDNMDMEVAVGKYMDTLDTFPVPFDFDRLKVDDAIKALNIVKIIDLDDIKGMAKEAKSYNDDMLYENDQTNRLDHLAASLVIDLGSDEANKLYKTIADLKERLTTEDPIYRESPEFNNYYRSAEGRFNVLLEKALPITKMLKVAPINSTLSDPSSIACWANIINDILIEDYPASVIVNAKGIRQAFRKGMEAMAPWAWDSLEKMGAAAIKEDSTEISQTIHIIWDALISGRPVIMDKYEEAQRIASECGAGELFDART